MTNRERYSETASSDRDGRCAISMCVFLPAAHYLTAWWCRPGRMPGSGYVLWRRPGNAVATGNPLARASGHRTLLRVELDDQLLGDVDDDLLARRQLVDEDPHRVGTGVEPCRHLALTVDLAGHDERVKRQRLLLDVDDVHRTHAEARHVHLVAVHHEVTVNDELASLAAGGREACAVHDVVETRLEDLQQHVAGLAGRTRRLFVVAAELLLENAVGEAGLLLLLE